jgi:preprotein translocase subunit SecF
MSEEFNKKVKQFYELYFKKLMIIPFALLFIAIFLIVFKVATTGDFINKGVSLKGGVTMTIPEVSGVDMTKFKSDLDSNFPGKDISIRSIGASGLVVDAGINDKVEIDNFVSFVGKELNLKQEQYTVEVMGASLGSSFFKETLFSIGLAFLFMSITVFLYFWGYYAPSFMVILCAFSDIITTLAIVNLLGIKLSTAGIAAFLMLIGYSVDTDILLSTRVLKVKEGSVNDKIFDAFGTGMMMTLTTLAAITVGLVFTKSDVIHQIMFILLIGLVCDIIFTWLQNAALLKLYVERKKHHE